MVNKVGAVLFRRKLGIIEILLVSSITRKRWLCPKGGVKKSENFLEACHRESFEEAGVKGNIYSNFPMNFLIESKSTVELINYPVIFYPLEVTYIYKEWPEKKRNRKWININDYNSLIKEKDYITVIEFFRKLLPTLPSDKVN